MELEEDEVVVKVVKMALAASGGPPHFYKQRFWWYFLLTILGVLCWLSILVECSGDIIDMGGTNVGMDNVETREQSFKMQQQHRRHHFDPPQPPPKAAASATSMKSGEKNDDLSQNEENHFEKIEMASGMHSENKSVCIEDSRVGVH